MENKPVEMTAEDAQKVIEEALRSRIDGCSEEVNAILKKYNCRLQIEQVIKVIPNK